MLIEHLRKAHLAAARKSIKEAINGVYVFGYQTLATNGVIAVHCLAEPFKTSEVKTPVIIPEKTVEKFLKIAKGCKEYFVEENYLISDQGQKLHFKPIQESYPDCYRLFIDKKYNQSITEISFSPEYLGKILEIFTKQVQVTFSFSGKEEVVKINPSQHSLQDTFVYLMPCRKK